MVQSVSINKFLKPAEKERYFTPAGHGRARGRGRGSRGGYHGVSELINVQAPSIEDPGQFPTLGGKRDIYFLCSCHLFDFSLVGLELEQVYLSSL